MSMIELYNEHAAAALTSVLPEMKRVGAGLSGILGNDGHTYGWHLSARRLRGTGKTSDKSLFGNNVPIVDDRAGCAIDIGMAWQASGEWLEDVRQRVKAGQLPEVSELIGDPDKIPGAPRDIKDACYAAPSTKWEWVNYSGQGHVTWCHVGIWRKHANDTRFGKKLLGGWSATGRIEEDDMDMNTKYPGGGDTQGRTVAELGAITIRGANAAGAAATGVVALSLKLDQIMAAVREEDVVTISPETIKALVGGVVDGVVSKLDVEIDEAQAAAIKAEVFHDLTTAISNG